VVHVHSKKCKRPACNNVDENKLEQYFAAHILPGCSQYCSTLFRNNMGSKILFKLVFIDIVIVTGWAVFAVQHLKKQPRRFNQQPCFS
jgi:hypothetical protein